MQLVTFAAMWVMFSNDASRVVVAIRGHQAEVSIDVVGGVASEVSIDADGGTRKLNPSMKMHQEGNLKTIDSDPSVLPATSSQSHNSKAGSSQSAERGAAEEFPTNTSALREKAIARYNITQDAKCAGPVGGCMMGCHCSFFQDCFPRIALMQTEGGATEPLDIGVCAVSNAMCLNSIMMLCGFLLGCVACLMFFPDHHDAVDSSGTVMHAREKIGADGIIREDGSPNGATARRDKTEPKATGTRIDTTERQAHGATGDSQKMSPELAAALAEVSGSPDNSEATAPSHVRQDS